MTDTTDKNPELPELPEDFDETKDSKDVHIDETLKLLDTIITWYFYLLIINKFGFKGFIFFHWIDQYAYLGIPKLLKPSNYHKDKYIRLDGDYEFTNVGRGFNIPFLFSRDRFGNIGEKPPCLSRIYKVNNKKVQCADTIQGRLDNSIEMILHLIIFMLFCIKSGLFEKSNLNVLNILKKDFNILDGSGGFIFK